MSSMDLSKGSLYEEVAIKYLKDKGYKIIDRNFLLPRIGEIDIIADDGLYIVFIEVKARKKTYYHPYETVNKTKQKRIIKVSIAWLKKNNIRTRPIRYDVVSIEDDNGDYHIEHIKSAFVSDGRYYI